MYTHVYTCIFMYTHCALHCLYDLHAGWASCCALAIALWVAMAVLSAWRLTQMIRNHVQEYCSGQSAKLGEVNLLIN